jgi:hypothetical protein
MQELVRRLLCLCERHGIELRLTHTPGAKLHRPDQTSRGDPIEEPRQRLARGEFGTLAAIHGPFSEFVGAERWHAAPMAEWDGIDRLWLHPSFATVGTALRLVMDRAREARTGSLRAVVLVPDDDSAQWWPLAKHFACSGRLSVGGGIEENRLGTWHETRRRRDVLILTYPRSAGATVVPVHLDPLGLVARDGQFGREGYTFEAEPPARLQRRVEPGSFFMGRADEGPWRLYVGGDSDGVAWRRRDLLALVPAGRAARTGGQRMTFRTAPEGEAERVHDDDLFVVGGALISEVTVERERRGVVPGVARGMRARVFEVPWDLLIALAEAAAAERPPMARHGDDTSESSGCCGSLASASSAMSLARRSMALGARAGELGPGDTLGEADMDAASGSW